MLTNYDLYWCLDARINCKSKLEIKSLSLKTWILNSIKLKQSENKLKLSHIGFENLNWRDFEEVKS